MYSFLLAPIHIAYSTKHKYSFKEGYFFTVAPGFYKANDFGVRLKNVLEVVDTGDVHFSGSKYLAFDVTTLVPFETKLIDKAMLSVEEVKFYLKYVANLLGDVHDLRQRGVGGSCRQLFLLFAGVGGGQLNFVWRRLWMNPSQFDTQ